MAASRCSRSARARASNDHLLPQCSAIFSSLASASRRRTATCSRCSASTVRRSGSRGEEEMARTKQTARKSTGGKAPRKQLATKDFHTGLANLAFRAGHGGTRNFSSGTFGKLAQYDDFTWRTSLARRSMQADIVNALRKGDRQRASFMLSNLQHIKGALTSEDFSYILEYSAEAPDPLFVMEILEIMEENDIYMSKNIYRSVTRALSKGGYPKEALHWLALLEGKESTYSALPIFNIFLSACLAVLQRNLPAVHDIWKDCTSIW